jgi:hypothetical protein
VADASFAIEIATSMPDGESTAAELDVLTAQLQSAGKGADFFQTAIKQVSAELAAATAASEAANAALATGEQKYGELERAALQTAKAAEKAALKNDGVVPFDLAARAAEAAMALDHHTDELRRLEREAGAAATEEDRLAQTLGNVKKLSSHVDKSLGAQAERLGKLQGALGAVGGPLGALGQGLISPVKGFQELSGSIGSARAAALLGAVGIAAVAAAVVAVTVAAIAGTIAIAAWAVGLADTARSAGLAREAVDAINPGIAELRGTMGELTTETGLGAAELEGLAKGLQGAGESSDSMAASLRVAALAHKALGAEGSSAYTTLVKAAADATAEAENAAEKTGAVPDKLAQKVADADAAVRAFATTANTKLGGIVAKQMMGLDAQTSKFKKNVGTLFGGLNIDPVLEGLQKLVALFDENTAAGETIKFLFESVFQPLIDSADEAATVVEAFALGFLIGLTKVYIALKPAIAAAKEFFGFEDSSLTDTLDLARKAGEYIVPAFLVFAGILGTIVVAIGLAVAAVVAIQLAIYSLFAAVVYVGAQIVSGFIGAFTAVTDFLGGIDLVQIGTDIMQGLADGIMGAAGAVVQAITGAVDGAVKAAKSALGIASPSKVFAEIGGYTGEGFAGGVDDSAGDAQDAMANMVAPPAAGAGGAPGGAGAAVSISGNTFIFNGVKDADDAEARFSELFTRLLEGDAMSAAGAEAAA